MAESEDNKEISLYIFPVTDDLIFFFKYHFETLLVDNALWSCIYQQERPHKTLKEITRTVDFGIPTLETFIRKNNFGVQ